MQLPVPIPLGYGFFFAGAGGLLGLNRGMDVDRIRDGLRAGTADSILFPTDIIRRIDVIVRDLEESFPQADGHFLIAPMAFIQWMNPALVTLKIGHHHRDRAAAAHRAARRAAAGAARRPTRPSSTSRSRSSAASTSAPGLLSFDASIYDSFIGYDDFKLSLEGDIAIRICWGSQPDLVASIGGFHPSYTPGGEPQAAGDAAAIRCRCSRTTRGSRLELYFAVTSNTIQFGARLEFFVGVSGFSISGDMGFDVLVQFAPFLIDAHMWAQLAVKAGGTDICSISLDLSAARSDAVDRARQGVVLDPVLQRQRRGRGQFRRGGLDLAAEPAGARPCSSRLCVTRSDWVAELAADALAGRDPDPAARRDAGRRRRRPAHGAPEPDPARHRHRPRRRGAPVRRLPDQHRGSALRNRRGRCIGASTRTSLAGFAPSTFAGAPTADADRLRAPAFEQRPTGVRVRSGAGLSSDAVVGHAVAYERIILDDDDAAAAAPAVRVTPPVNFGALVAGGAAGSSAAARRRSAGDERGTRPCRVADRTAVRGDESRPARRRSPTTGRRPRPATAREAGCPVRSSRAAMPRHAGPRCRPTGGRYQIVPEVQLVH